MIFKKLRVRMTSVVPFFSETLFNRHLTPTKKVMCTGTILFTPRFITGLNSKLAANGARCPRSHLNLQPKLFLWKPNFCSAINPPICKKILQNVPFVKQMERQKRNGVADCVTNVICWYCQSYVQTAKTRSNYEHALLAIKQNLIDFIMKSEKNGLRSLR